MAAEGASDLEKLQALYEEWARGDFSHLDIWDESAEMDTFGLVEPMKASGREDVARTLAGWLSAWERPLVIEADELIQRGARILVMVHWKGRGRGSGAELDAEGAHLWTFREGRAVRFDVYRDRDEARAALLAG
jgi:ketosteroid isomerase-like protein